MNCFQVRFFSRSGAGSMPAAAKISATVVRPISIASPVRNASLILVYPQPGLAMAISTTSLRTSLGLGGRPRLASELSYFLAANWRNHARIVAGLTSRQYLRRSSGVSNLPPSARRRRWWAVKEIFLPPVRASTCSQRMRLSSST